MTNTPPPDHDASTADIPSDSASSGAFFELGGSTRMPEMPERIGPYRLVRELGKGGMGIVYLAVRDQDKLKKRVALKLIKKGVDTESVLGRFDLERQVLSALNHPGIARLLDAGSTDDGRPYFVMEYIDGQPIDEYCDTHRLTIPERLELFCQACSAVHAAHQNLILHRDLKPGNILVTSDGKVKLLDFGIAKLLNPDLSPVDFVTTIFGAERPPMTPEYASPEQVRNMPLTTSSDIYSLGVLLYELLTGCRPYRLSTRVREEIQRIICDLDPDRPSTALTRVSRDDEAAAESDVHDPAPVTRHTTEAIARDRRSTAIELSKTLRGDLDNIILMAMDKSPQRRYESASQFAEDIQRHLKQEPTIARPMSKVEKLLRFVRHHRGPVAAVFAIVVILAAAATISTSLWRRADAANTRTESVAVAANDVIEFMLTDLNNDLKNLPLSMEYRQMMLDAAVDYLAEVDGVELSTSVDIRRQLGMVQIRIGQLHFGTGRNDKGARSQAEQAYQAAIQRLEQLHNEYPEDAGTQLWLGWAYRYMAWFKVKTVDEITGTESDRLRILGDAEALYAQSLAVAESVLKTQEHTDKAKQLKSFTQLGLGDVARKRADFDPSNVPKHLAEAARLYAIEVASRQTQVAEAEGIAAKQKAIEKVITALNRMAYAVQLSGDVETARQLGNESLALAKHWHSAMSLNSMTKLWTSYLIAASALSTSTTAQDLDQATVYFESALDLMESVRDEDPSNAGVQSIIPTVQSQFALFLIERRGQVDRGCELLDDAIGEFQALLVEDIDSPSAREKLLECREAQTAYCDT